MWGKKQTSEQWSDIFWTRFGWSFPSNKWSTRWRGGGELSTSEAAATGEFDKDWGILLVEVLAPDKSDTAGQRESVLIVGNGKPGELGVKLGKGIRSW